MKQRLMSVSRIGLLCLGALVVPAESSAAETTPHITPKMDANFMVTARLENGNDFKICSSSSDRNYGWSSVIMPSTSTKPVELASIRLGTRPGDETARFVSNLLEPGAKVLCTTDGSERPRQGSWKSIFVQDLQLATTTSPLRSSIPALLPDYAWNIYAGGWRNTLFKMLGLPTSCAAMAGDKEVGTCIPGSLDPDDNSLRFKVENAARADHLKVSFMPGTQGKQNKPLDVLVDLESCTFQVTGRLPVLVAGAAEQRLAITTEKPICYSRLSQINALKIGSARIPASEDHSRRLDGTWWGSPIIVSGIPADLPQGQQSVELHGTGGELGKLNIEVLKPITAASTLHVDYEVEPKDDLGGYFENATGSSEKIAVVNPIDSTYDHGSSRRIVNTASLTITAPLPRVSQRLVNITEPAPLEEDEDFMPKRDMEDILYWRVVSTGWGGKVHFRDCRTLKSPPAAPNNWGSEDCALTGSVDSLVFDVHQRFERELKVRLALMRVIAGTKTKKPTRDTPPQDDTSSPAAIEEQLLLVDVPLADRSRRESVPMPIRDRLLVDCKDAHDYVYHGETKAIGDDDVVGGECSLIFFPNRIGPMRPPERKLNLFAATKEQDAAIDNFLARLEMERLGLLVPGSFVRSLEEIGLTEQALPEILVKNEQLNMLYGPQELSVTIKQDGGDPTTKILPIDPDRLSKLTLPIPPGTQNGSNLYTVEVKLVARSNSVATYRGSTKAKIEADQIERSDLYFVAHLRPRGIFGIKMVPMRIYATIPVQMTGFRFPAAPAELRSSTDPTAFQFVTPRVGALVVFEPWNYNTGTNPCPLRPSLAWGFSVVELTKPVLSMSHLLGIQLQLPLFDAPSQLGTSLSSGAFWEHDLEYGSNRFLLTLGVNVLTLFAGK